MVCGWKTHVAGTSRQWWCGRSFAHAGPHMMVNRRGDVCAEEALFTHPDVRTGR